MPRKKHTEKVPNVTFGIHYKEDTKPLDDAPSKTAEQQQDSSPRHAKTTPKKCLTLPLESIKEDTKQPLAERPRELESPASKAFGGAPPKHSNSSRIRTHATQKAHRKSA